MIVYGLTMQHKPQEVPAEVAAWLFERNARYPNIDFKLDYSDALPRGAEETALARKYSRMFGFHGGHVDSVNFLYLKEAWFVRIIGGLDRDGNIVNSSFPGEVRALGTLRNEIAGYAPNMGEELSGEAIGVLRTKNEPATDKPTSMVPLPSDLRWTSEVSMSGKEFGELLTNPETREEAQRALWAKDWQTLKHLREKL